MDRIARIAKKERDLAALDAPFAAAMKKLAEKQQLVDAKNKPERERDEAKRDLDNLSTRRQAITNDCDAELRADAAGLIDSARDEFLDIRDKARKRIDPRDGDSDGARACFNAALAALTALPEIEISADPAKAIQSMRAAISPLPSVDGVRTGKTLQEGDPILVGS